jgi:O-antigen ligase
MNRINFHLNSNIERKEIYKQSIDLIKKKPLLGYGQLNFAFLNKSEFKDSIKINKGNAESQFLQLLLENGLFGFFAYFLIYLSIYLSGLNRKGKYLLLFSFTYSFFLVVQVYYFFWIMLFSSLAYKKQ